MSAEVFEAADACDYEKLAELLIAMPEKERRALHDQLVEKTVERASQHFQMPNLPARYVHQIAHVGAGTAKDYASWWAMWVDRDGLSAPNLADVLLCRPTNVYKGIARAIFRSGAGFYFVTLYDLMQRGLIDRPPEAQLQTAMLQSIRTNRALFSDQEAVDVLLGAMQDESVIRSANNFWVDEVVEGVVDGTLPREQLLSEVLRALCRDFKPGVSAAFRQMFEKLAPTVDELQQRSNLLVQMLAGGLSPNQTVAAESLLRVHTVEPISDLAQVTNAIASALATPQKTTAMAAFRLLQALELDQVTKASTAVIGLVHPNADVQLAALKALESCGSLPKTVLSEALMAEATIAPKHRDRLSVLMGSDISITTESDVFSGETMLAERQLALAARLAALPGDIRARLGIDEASSASLAAWQWPKVQVFGASAVPMGRRLDPITDPDELVELLLTSSIGSVSALDIERIVDGVSRIRPPIGASERVAALQTAELVGLSWSSQALRFALLKTAFSWSGLQAHGSYPYLAKPSLLHRSVFSHDLKAEPSTRNYFQAFDGGAGPSGVVGFVAAKLWESVTICLSEPRMNLAFPSNEAGWIFADDLCGRLELLKEREETPGRFEALHALARLHPEHDHQILQRLETIGSPVALAAADVLRGSVSTTRDEGLDRAVATRPLPEAFVAASSGEYQRTYDFRFERKPGAEIRERRRDDPIGEMEFELFRLPSPERSHWWSALSCAAPTLDPDLMRWTQIAFPKDLPIFEARIATCIGESIEENRSSDSLHLTVSALADPDHPWTAPSYVLLGVALAAKSQTLAAAGVDAFFAGATDGRLDAQRLGRVLAQLSTSSFLKPSRLADRLTKIVQTSPLVAEQIRRVLEVFLAGISALPQGSAALLELLDIACSQTHQAIEDPAARAVLEAASIGSSKTATSAKRLLQLAAASNIHLVLDATEALIVRAERWAAAGSQ
jgi:hypothetical protein